ncbi:MAG: helix-turn-helix domain-containing protein [Muribaculaceae bacterium]|nr:helix-turn-helix domain-containing protein [Muribaculaceae bacterium]
MTALDATNNYWKISDERLGINEAGLYFALVDLANKKKWSETFKVGNEIICMKLNIDPKTFRKARQNLIDCGLISINPGVGRNTTMYSFGEGKFPPQNPSQKGGYKGGNKLPPDDSIEDNQDTKTPREGASAPTPTHAYTHEEEPTEFDKSFGEFANILLGHAGDIWRQEMSKAHGVTNFNVAFEQFRSYVIQNALERNIQSQHDFRRYFNWRAKDFLKEPQQEAEIKYFATIEKLSDTKWVVHQYGGTDPIPVGTPDPPSPYHAWTGTQWEHI